MERSESTTMDVDAADENTDKVKKTEEKKGVTFGEQPATVTPPPTQQTTKNDGGPTTEDPSEMPAPVKLDGKMAGPGETQKGKEPLTKFPAVPELNEEIESHDGTGHLV